MGFGSGLEKMPNSSYVDRGGRGRSRPKNQFGENEKGESLLLAARRGATGVEQSRPATISVSALIMRGKEGDFGGGGVGRIPCLATAAPPT